MFGLENLPSVNQIIIDLIKDSRQNYLSGEKNVSDKKHCIDYIPYTHIQYVF